MQKQLRDLDILEVGKTHSVEESKKLYYILLKKDEQHFTVFTTEGKGFVMTCTTKPLLVDVCFTPTEENVSLTTYRYADPLYETLRLRALRYLEKPSKKFVFQSQGKELLFETKAISDFITKEHTANIAQYANTLDRIRQLEVEAKDATPIRKEQITYYIERGAIAKAIKKITGYKCAICEGLGLVTNSFTKITGLPYIEVHHIEQVSYLKKGALSVDNMITVCANHHRQFHYGNLKIVNQDETYFYFELGGKNYKTLKPLIQC